MTNATLTLGDLNANETKDDVSDSLRDFFRLLITGKGESGLSRQIAEEVEKARTHNE